MTEALALALAWALHLAEAPPALIETARLVTGDMIAMSTSRGDALLTAAVCVQESRAGLDPRALSRCGVRWRGRYVSDPAESVRVAALSLRRWRLRCNGNARQALTAYHLGRGCRAQDRSSYAGDVLSIEARLRALMPLAARAIAEATAIPPNLPPDP